MMGSVSVFFTEALNREQAPGLRVFTFLKELKGKQNSEEYVTVPCKAFKYVLSVFFFFFKGKGLLAPVRLSQSFFLRLTKSLIR